MPTYRGISLTLHSHYDVLPLTEYPLPSTSPLAVTDDAKAPHVLIASRAGSIFWIRYAIAPPIPKSQFFLFKLRIDGKQIVNWSAGAEAGFDGKVVCGLFDAGRGQVERRAFRFTERNGESEAEGCIEIDVFRANGRKRIARRVEKWDTDQGPSGVKLIPAGRAGPEIPKRFYKFALIDPIDQPFAQFRFNYCPSKQLEEMEVLPDKQVGEDNELPVIEPFDIDDDDVVQKTKILGNTSRGTAFRGNTPQETASQESTSEESTSEESTSEESTSRENDLGDDWPRRSEWPLQNSIDSAYVYAHDKPEINDPFVANEQTLSPSSPYFSTFRRPHEYRLSIPPKLVLNPICSNTPVPPIPIKTGSPVPPETPAPTYPVRTTSLGRKESFSSTTYRPHPAFSVGERPRTTSPTLFRNEPIPTFLVKKGFLEKIKGWGRSFSRESSREDKYGGSRSVSQATWRG